MAKLINVGFIIGGVIASVMIVNILYFKLYPLLVVPILFWILFTRIGYTQISTREEDEE